MQKIHKILEDSYFTVGCFSVTYPDTGDYYIDIRYLDRNDIYFNWATNSYATYSPGEVLEVTQIAVNFDNCMRQITTWLSCIRNELRAIHSPIFRELDEMRQAFNNAINDKIDDPNSLLSKEEIDHLKQALDGLYKQFESLQQDNVITKEELSKIKSALQELQKDTESLPKKPWFRAAGNTILKFGTNLMSSPAGQKIIEEGTRKLLEPPS
jgi:hypothetical protein